MRPSPLEQAAQYAADRWADYLNQPGGTGSVFTDEIHRRQRSPLRLPGAKATELIQP